MNVIVAGSRSITDQALVTHAIQESPFEVQKIIHGNAEGVDKCAGRYGLLNDLSVHEVPPDYEKYSYDLAPLKRNEEMVEMGEALIAVWGHSDDDNELSSGTEHIIKEAVEQGLPVYIESGVMQDV